MLKTHKDEREILKFLGPFEDSNDNDEATNDTNTVFSAHKSRIEISYGKQTI
jgi:hypothetical protein